MRRFTEVAVSIGISLLAAGLAHGATLTLPTVGVMSGQPVIVPLTIDNAGGLLAADIHILYNDSVLQATNVAKTPLSEPFTLTSNLGVDGNIYISLFGITPLSGGGALVNIKFTATGTSGQSSVLDIVSADLNEGAIGAVLQDGMLSIIITPIPVPVPPPPPPGIPGMSFRSGLAFAVAIAILGVLAILRSRRQAG